MLSVSGMVLCIPLARLRRLTQLEKEQHQRNEKATLRTASEANREAIHARRWRYANRLHRV